jgi:hypothetical protein
MAKIAPPPPKRPIMVPISTAQIHTVNSIVKYQIFCESRGIGTLKSGDLSHCIAQFFRYGPYTLELQAAISYPLQGM